MKQNKIKALFNAIENADIIEYSKIVLKGFKADIKIPGTHHNAFQHSFFYLNSDVYSHIPDYTKKQSQICGDLLERLQHQYKDHPRKLMQAIGIQNTYMLMYGELNKDAGDIYKLVDKLQRTIHKELIAGNNNQVDNSIEVLLGKKAQIEKYFLLKDKLISRNEENNNKFFPVKDNSEIKEFLLNPSADTYKPIAGSLRIIEKSLGKIRHMYRVTPQLLGVTENDLIHIFPNTLLQKDS